MALVTKRELRQLMQLHYILEILLALAYLILKKIPWIAIRVFDSTEFQAVETELLIFTLILIVFKNKRRGHLNFLPYLSSACTMAKIGNSLLFFYAKPAYAFTYLSCNIAHYVLFPKPKYKGPERISYYLGDDFEKELAKDKNISWLIEFYESWNPDCNEFAGVFSELSAKRILFLCSIYIEICMPIESVNQDNSTTHLSIDDDNDDNDKIVEVHPDGNETLKSLPISNPCSTQANNKTEKPIYRSNPHINGDGDYTEPAQACVQTVDDTLTSGDHQGSISSDLEQYGDDIVAQIINDLLKQF